MRLELAQFGSGLTIVCRHFPIGEVAIDFIEQTKNNVRVTFHVKRGVGAMLKVFVEEAAALASVVLFVGMVAVWAQVIPQF